MTPRTTFASGFNPFQGLGVLPTQPEPTMQKPTKPAKTKRATEDYSTPYQPPAPELTPQAEQIRQIQPLKLSAIPVTTKKPNAPANYTDPDTLQITDDPMPMGRAAPVNKYFTKFDAMKLGQCVRCASGDVGKISGALRKYITVKNKKAMIKTVSRFEGDEGFGRVWLLPVAGKVLRLAS